MSMKYTHFMKSLFSLSKIILEFTQNSHRNYQGECKSYAHDKHTSHKPEYPEDIRVYGWHKKDSEGGKNWNDHMVF